MDNSSLISKVRRAHANPGSLRRAKAGKPHHTLLLR
jgi:hypothetical protein